MQNQIEYKPGADLRFNNTVESQLLFGKGWAYGVELFIKKKYGKFNGWVGYTLSRSMRSFNGIDSGKTFPPNRTSFMMFPLSAYINSAPNGRFQPHGFTGQATL